MIVDALDIAAALCRRFEGFRPRPYLCPAGVPTIGYGSTRYADGRAVTLLDAPISEPQARRMLLADLRHTRLPAVLRLAPEADTPERLAALIDFAYNLGLGNLRASTLLRRVKCRDWAQAQVEIKKWVKGGGRILPGLVARRAAEAALLQG